MINFFSQLKEMKLLIGSILFFAFFMSILSDHFFWDAAIIEVAILENNFSGLRELTNISGLPINFWYFFLSYKLSQLLTIPAGVIFTCTLLLWMLGLVREVGIFCIDNLQFNDREAYFLRCIILALPLWNILASQVLHFYIFTYYLLFLGFNLFKSKSFLCKFLGLVCFAISFGNAANNLMVMALFTMPLIQSLASKEKKELKANIYNLIAISLFSILFFITYRAFFPPISSFEGYNSLALVDINNYIYGALVYGFWFLISIIIFSFSLLVAKLLQSKIQFNSNVNLRDTLSLLATLFLLMCAAIPYIAVTKQPPTDTIQVWEARHALLFFLILAPFIVSLNKLFLKESRLALTVFVFFLLSISAHHHVGKVYDELYFSILEESLPDEPPKPGFILINSDLSFSNALRHYDLGNVFYKKYNAIEWHIEMADDIPGWAKDNNLKNPYLGLSKMSNLIGKNFNCVTAISIEPNEVDTHDLIDWVLYQKIPKTEAKITREDCAN